MATMMTDAQGPLAAAPVGRPGPGLCPGAGGDAVVRGVVVGLLMALLLAMAPAASGQEDLLTGNPQELTEAAPLSPIEARDMLARAAYLPNLTGFQSAIEAGDIAAIPLYQASGLELSGDTVRAYLNPVYTHQDAFDPAVATLLLKGGVDRSAFCINPSGSWDHYLVASRELDHQAEREAFLRGLCGDDDTVLAIRALYEAESLQLAALALANEDRPARVDACIAEFESAHPMDATLAAAQSFSLFEVDRITPPHDTVMMELSSWHMSGQQAEPEVAYAEAVANGCGAAIPVHVVNTSQRDRLGAVLAVLRPEMALFDALAILSPAAADEG